MWSLQTVKSSGRSSLRAVTWLFDSSHVFTCDYAVKICQDMSRCGEVKSAHFQWLAGSILHFEDFPGKAAKPRL